MFGGAGPREENGTPVLQQITSFLRSPRLPGKARLNRREVDIPSGADLGPGASSLDSPATGTASGSRSPATAPGTGRGRGTPTGGGSGVIPGGAWAGTGAGSSTTDAVAAAQVAALRLHGSGEPSTSAPNGSTASPVQDGGTSSNSAPTESCGVSQSRASSAIRVSKFHRILSEPVVDLDALRELSWSGIPTELRPLCWRLLLGYLPPNRARQAQVLLRKRREYADMVPEFYEIENSERSEDEIGALRQVSVDVPRTAPTVPFFHEPVIQKSLERMLYIWGIRHPASGYVQGMNDLVTPFLAVFLSDCLKGPMSEWKAEDLSEATMLDVEADCYWCLSRLLEGIQDHYTYAQPGIQRSVFRLKELVRKQHEALVAHMEAEGVDFLQFAFRWVNCLLIREVPFDAALRLWDTYLAEGPGFADFLVYVCAAFLARWERPLLSMEFQDLMLFLQKLPTNDWGDTEMESVLSAAFVLRNVWQHAQSHLQA